jgi:phage terminase large subunit-like protein
LVGVAVKVTEVPVQIVPAGTATILTLAGNNGLTIMVIVFDVAGEPVRQGVALEVISQVIASPLFKAVDV